MIHTSMSLFHARSSHRPVPIGEPCRPTSSRSECRVLSTKGVLLARSRLPAPWGMRLEARAQVTFHIVTEGLLAAARGRCPLALHQGDLGLLPQGLAHELAHARDGRAEPIERLLERRCILPTGGPLTTMVCGAYCLRRPACPSRCCAGCRRSCTSLQRGGARQPPALGGDVAGDRRAGSARSGRGAGAAPVRRPVPVHHCGRGRRRAASAPGGCRRSGTRRSSRALAGMHADPAAPWTVETLARRRGCRARAFARRFTASWATAARYPDRAGAWGSPRGSCSRARRLWPRVKRAGWATSRSSPSAGPSSAAAGWPRHVPARPGRGGRESRSMMLLRLARASRVASGHPTSPLVRQK